MKLLKHKFRKFAAALLERDNLEYINVTEHLTLECGEETWLPLHWGISPRGCSDLCARKRSNPTYYGVARSNFPSSLAKSFAFHKAIRSNQ